MNSLTEQELAAEDYPRVYFSQSRDARLEAALKAGTETETREIESWRTVRFTCRSDSPTFVVSAASDTQAVRRARKMFLARCARGRAAWRQFPRYPGEYSGGVTPRRGVAANTAACLAVSVSGGYED